MIRTANTNHTTRSPMMKILAIHYCLAALCLTSAFSGSRAASMTTTPASTASPSYTVNGAFRRPVERRKRRPNALNVLGATKEELASSSSLPLSSNNNEDEGNPEITRQTDGTNDEIVVESSETNHADEIVTSLLTSDALSSSTSAVAPSTTSSSSNSASRRNRRKKIAMGLVASIATAACAAKIGLLGEGYSDPVIARDAFMTGLTSVLAVVLNRGITWGYEAGKYDSKTGRKLAHILSAPLFIFTWPFFSNASGARVFAGLVTLTNMYRLYLAGTGDAAESSLANTISRSGDKAEVLGGPFIYVCLFQCFILAFWRNTFPGVVAMTTMAAGDGMADIIGRRYGKKGFKWPFGDGQKSLVGTLAFAFFAFGLTLGISSWLIGTGTLPSVLGFSELARRILAISCICALVEVLPIGDDNYTVPGSAALLSWLWLR